MITGQIKKGPDRDGLRLGLLFNQWVPLTIWIEGDEREVRAKIKEVKQDSYEEATALPKGFVIKGRFEPGLDGNRSSFFETLYDVEPVGGSFHGPIFIDDRTFEQRAEQSRNVCVHSDRPSPWVRQEDPRWP